jgi:hypothetical protein
MERDHARNLLKLSEQTKATLNADINNNTLPLVQIFEQLMDKSTEFATHTEQTITLLNQRFINVSFLDICDFIHPIFRALKTGKKSMMQKDES